MKTTNLLEQSQNTVTQATNEHGARYEISKCRCDCWFCPDCAKVKGYNLRARLVPILQTFKDLLLVTFTIDPELFSSPQQAYEYAMDNRCISVTTQDLYRWGHLNSRKYFYVIEWQKETEQVHFHVLYDSNYIPWNALRKSWSKHRPKSAGPVKGNRPAFGTVLFSKIKFQGGFLHAARYVTKYLTKTPEEGFPEWALNMGKNRTIRRFGTSRGFWNESSKRSESEAKYKRKNKRLSYKERLKSCGQTSNIFKVKEVIDKETGEITTKKFWIGQVNINSEQLHRLWDPGNPKRFRRSLMGQSPSQIQRILENTAGGNVHWIRQCRTSIAS